MMGPAWLHSKIPVSPTIYILGSEVPRCAHFKSNFQLGLVERHFLFSVEPDAPEKSRLLDVQW